MSHLSWLPDEALNSAVNELKDRANRAREKAGESILRNTIDPFASLVIAHTYRVENKEALRRLQEAASTQSGIANAVGHFHQRILGSIDGWTNHDAGYDLENRATRMVAEVKNKHNTMNAGNKQQVLMDLDTAVRQKGKGWKGYLVIIIPKNRDERYERRLLSCKRPVYQIDGASFYAMATGGIESAMQDLYEATESILQQDHSMNYGVSDYCQG